MNFFFTVSMVFLMILCVILIFVILSQNPQGGGLSGTFGRGGGTQMFGVHNTNKFMEKATWTLVCIIMIVILFASTIIADPSGAASYKKFSREVFQE